MLWELYAGGFPDTAAMSGGYSTIMEPLEHTCLTNLIRSSLCLTRIVSVIPCFRGGSRSALIYNRIFPVRSGMEIAALSLTIFAVLMVSIAS